MELTAEIIGGLGVALNEATLVGLELDIPGRRAGITFDVLTLPMEGEPAEDCRLLLVLSNVGRVAASYRLGNWNHVAAEVVALKLEALTEVVTSFGQQPIYGRHFFDRSDDFSTWADRLSLDARLDGGLAHSLLLFQEGAGDRHLDLCIWFDLLSFRDPLGNALSPGEVIAGGQRWWESYGRYKERGPTVKIPDQQIIPLP